jgi:CRP-like cAMP-binding protein
MKADPILLEELSGLGFTKDFPKNKTLLAEGEVSGHAYVVKSGCVRLWQNQAGNDISVKFFLPGELCASLESLYRQTPSKYILETISPTKLQIFDKDEMQKRAQESPRFREYSSAVMVHCLVDYQDLFSNRISHPPEERYRLLLSEEPEVLDHVPLHYIASYLGITPVSLSRIRKKLAST